MKLINGDCLEEMRKIEDGSIDMILCDLPYGTTACKWDTIIPFDKLWEQYNRIIKPNGVIALFGTEPFSSLLRCSNLKYYKYDLVWDKVKPGNPLIAKHRPLNHHENISIFYKKAGKYNPIMEKRTTPKTSKNYKKSNIYIENTIKEQKEKTTYTHKYPKAILKFSNANQKGKVHPTQKPVELLEYLIKTYTNEGETVLDNCTGSGSTGVACVNTNRRFIGIELDKNYFEIAKKRIEEAKNEVN